MTRDETRRYLEQRLLFARESDWAPGEDDVEAIQREAGGVPRTVSERASALFWRDRSRTGLGRLGQ